MWDQKWLHSLVANVPGAIYRCSFVLGVPEDANAAVLVGGVVDLARSLGLRPLAEGVETAEQREYVIARGCELGQGYFFSKPVPAAEVPAYAPPGTRSTATAS